MAATPSIWNELADIGAALAPAGEVLLWSCHAGADAEGRAFTGLLAEAIGARVVAPAGLVGNGAWHLDAANPPPLTPRAQAAYAHTLTTVWDQDAMATDDSNRISSSVIANDFSLSASFTLQGATVILADDV